MQSRLGQSGLCPVFKNSKLIFGVDGKTHYKNKERNSVYYKSSFLP